MSNDLYEAPKTNLVEDNNQPDELASRWARLGASLVDSLIMMVIMLPIMYVSGYLDLVKEGQEQIWMAALIALMGLLVFFGINLKFLVATGQTLGKKALRIKITDMQGHVPLLGDHIWKRYLTYFLPGNIPLIGQLFAFVNILFIFRKDKRCIHDLVAGTQVVKA